MSKKIIGLLLAGLIVAGAVGGFIAMQGKQSPKSQKKEEELTKYTNLIMHFSMMVPNWTYGYEWMCSNPEQKEERLPLKTFYDIKKGVVSIAPEYILADDATKTRCGKVAFSQDLPDPKKAGFLHWWEIRSAPVQDEKTLTAFIKKQYGSACGLEKLEKTAQEDVFNAIIKENSIEPGKPGSCFINYAYAIKYVPAERKAFYWNIGQEDNWRDAQGKGYDQRMIESFRYERPE